jgi:hypothetical protein
VVEADWRGREYPRIDIWDISREQPKSFPQIATGCGTAGGFSTAQRLELQAADMVAPIIGGALRCCCSTRAAVPIDASGSVARPVSAGPHLIPPSSNVWK